MYKASASVLKIKSKTSERTLGTPSKSFFETSEIGCGDFIDLYEKGNLTLYCFDTKNRKVIFTELPSTVDLSTVPFYYQTQYDFAQKLISISYEDFYRIGTFYERKDIPLILIYSIGRCGSTLGIRILGEVSNVTSYSEPDVFSQIGQFYSSGLYSDCELIQMIRSSVAFICKPLDLAKTVWALKIRMSATNMANLFQQAFPQVKSFFLYRNAIDWAKSRTRFISTMKYPKKDSVNDYRHSMGHLSKAIALYEKNVGREFYYNEFIAYLWSLRMEQYEDFHQKGILTQAVRYDELVTDSTYTLKTMFDYCGISHREIPQALRAFEKDSQEGTKISRKNMLRGGEYELTEKDITFIHNYLRGHTKFLSSEYILPGTVNL